MTSRLNDGLRIGITIGLQKEDESLWNNGIKQNAVFLAEAIKQSDRVRSVKLINTTSVQITSGLPWDLNRWPTISFEQAKDDLDILIELGGQINAQQTDYIKRSGARLVSYCCGFEYVHAMESIIFGRPLWGYDLFINQRYDDIWMIPQVANISGHFFSTLRRLPAKVVPFVWDPMFIGERSKDFPNQGKYLPRAGPRRLSVMEANIDVVKFCLYPILIAEEAYRKRPDSIGFLNVTNAERFARESKDFIALMNQLEIVRQHKAAFVGLYETPRFLAEATDVMISHQWENALNYFYLEVCWQGYPLIHNAELCSDLGYYYQGNDVKAGCAALLQAIETHDSHWREYVARQQQLIERFLPTNREVTGQYERLLVEVAMQQPR